MKSVMLKDLKPGDMFRRESGNFRYVVSSHREESCGNVAIYCYNLDGESDGYEHGGSEMVVLIEPNRLPIVIADEFWMVHVEGGDAPRRRHFDVSLAAAEAERLSKTTGKVAYLLHAVSAIFPAAAVPASHWIELRRQ